MKSEKAEHYLTKLEAFNKKYETRKHIIKDLKNFKAEL